MTRAVDNYMGIAQLFRPVSQITEADRERSLRNMNWQAISASGADGLASGGFLAAFALILGASNFHIGVMTAIPFIVQPLQIFAVMVVERMRRRKVVAVVAYFIAYLTWIPIGLIPFFIDVPNAGAVTLMLAFIALRGVANAFVNTSWNGWLRDIVPQDIMGKFFAQRLRVATIAAATASLLAAFYIDWWKASGPAAEVFAYSYAMLFGSIVLGFGAVGFMARMVEPQMAIPEGTRPSVLHSLGAPLKDVDFRHLIYFLFLWNFVAHLAVPFFSVYMLTKLGLPLTWVVGLGVFSQVFNVLFLRVWGPMVDKFGSKVVLSLCSSLYFLVILGWTFTTMPDKHALTMPLLALLHMLIGIASAGINISTTTIRMKMAPQAQATAYLTAASLAANVGAGISPLLGGAFADFFSVRHLEVAIEWVDPVRSFEFPAVYLTGFDFLFAIAFVLGIATLGVLAQIREVGEVRTEVVMDELMGQTRENLRVLNSVPGLSFVANFPIESFRRLSQLPGLDVALGVTVHQLSSSIKAAVETLNYGREKAGELQDKIGEAVETASGRVEDIGRQGAAVALEATLGVIQAANEAKEEVGRLTEVAIHGTLKALGKTATDPRDALRGAAYGAVQGAGEANLPIDEVAAHTVKAAREAALDLGLTEQEAVACAAQAAMESAAQFGKQAQVEKAVLEELLSLPAAQTAPKGGESGRDKNNRA